MAGRVCFDDVSAYESMTHVVSGIDHLAPLIKRCQHVTVAYGKSHIGRKHLVFGLEVFFIIVSKVYGVSVCHTTSWSTIVSWGILS